MGCELLGVLYAIQIACQTHTTDDEFAHGTLGHGHPGLIDDSQVPAVQRETDTHGCAAVEDGGAGDDRRLRGAVGVPHLTAIDREPLAQFGRAGFATENQQSHIVEGFRGPEGGEGRHCGDDGDTAGGQPRTEVEAASHQRSRRRDEARSARPGEPHLLDRGIEGHREAGQHAVAGAERLGSEEQPRLRIHEGGRGAMGHGDALRCSRRA